ncbi:MAG: hypothetical protein JXQ75_14385 [Phycisphaerae bacterium]|nr:hypothetical protein [Phycisphaerae bacterium]
MIREERVSRLHDVSQQEHYSVVEGTDPHAVRGRVWELLGLERVPGMRYELSRDQVIQARYGLNDPQVREIREILGDMDAPIEEFTVTLDGWFVYAIADVASTCTITSDGTPWYRTVVRCRLSTEDADF